MTSTITLYQGVPFGKGKNIAVDELEDYLSALPANRKIVFSNQNYIRQNLTATIRLELNQMEAEFNSENWNYCSIENYSDSGISQKQCYYFIDKLEQVSRNVLRLDLFLDSLNTIGTNISLTKKTLIHREHKDRWKPISGQTYSDAIIDIEAEGLNPTLYKTNESDVKSESFKDFSWYIIYMNSNDISPNEFNQVNPVKAIIAPSHDISVRGNLTTFSLPMDGRTYVISTYLNNANGVGYINNIPIYNEKIEDMNTSAIDFQEYSNAKEIFDYMTITPSSGSYSIQVYHDYYDKDGARIAHLSGQRVTASTLTASGLPGTIKALATKGTTVAAKYVPNYTIRSNEEGQINGVDILDKTNAKLIKIIELPYCPVEITEIYQDIYSFNYPIQLEDIGFTIKGHNLEFLETYLNIKNYSFSEIPGKLRLRNVDAFGDAVRNNAYEPKLFNSELYLKKFIYDSFSIPFKFEYLNIPDSITRVSGGNLKIKEITSLAVTSKFLFDFNEMLAFDKSLEDYSYVLPVARNNESTIYTSQYINYLRTGLQYDLKMKAAQEENSYIRTAISAIGSIGSIALGVASGNPAVAVGGVIASSTGLAGSIISTIQQENQTSNSLAQKQAQLQEQKASVQNSDDLALLKYYTKGNFAKIATYEPSEKQKNRIALLFHYCGYKAEYLGIPNLNSRLRFNYIQADIDISETAQAFLSSNFNNDIIENYKGKWAEGITIMHHFRNKWNFEQDLENWETVLENRLQ